MALALTVNMTDALTSASPPPTPPANVTEGEDVTDDVRRIVLPGNHVYYEDTLEVILAEAARSRGVAGSVIEGMRQRATLLAGTASIAASIAADPAIPLTWIPVALFAVAALAGIAVFWPRVGVTVDPTAVFNVMVDLERPQATYALAKSINNETAAIRVTVKKQKRFVLAGLTALAAGIVATAII